MIARLRAALAMRPVYLDDEVQEQMAKVAHLRELLAAARRDLARCGVEREAAEMERDRYKSGLAYANARAGDLAGALAVAHEAQHDAEARIALALAQAGSPDDDREPMWLRQLRTIPDDDRTLRQRLAVAEANNRRYDQRAAADRARDAELRGGR